MPSHPVSSHGLVAVHVRVRRLLDGRMPQDVAHDLERRARRDVQRRERVCRSP